MSVARCPMCHLANEGTAWRCDRCGYEFGQSIETLRGLLTTQLHNAWISLGVLLFIDLALVAITLYCALVLGRVVMPGLGFVVCVAWTVRAARKIGVSRHSLKLIAAKDLPKATLLPK